MARVNFRAMLGLGLDMFGANSMIRVKVKVNVK